MKKYLITALALLLTATSAYAAEEKKEGNILKKILETAISPVENVLGPITDLGQIVVAPTKTKEKVAAAVRLFSKPIIKPPLGPN